MNGRKLGRKTFLSGLLTVFLTVGFIGSVSAAVTLTSLKIEQGKLLTATVPQFENGMDINLLVEYNKEYRQAVLEGFSKFETLARKIQASCELPDTLKGALTFYAGYDVYRNDGLFVSLGQKFYQYTGGAHGKSWLRTSTINLQVGRSYILSDLFVEGSNFSEHLGEIVRREGKKRNLPLWNFKGVVSDSSFYLTDEGVVLFFQPYEIAPYSEGIVRFLIPYRDIADLLIPEIRL